MSKKNLLKWGLSGAGCLITVGFPLALVFGFGLLYYFTGFRGQQALLSQDESRFDPILEKDNVLKLAGEGAEFLSFSATGVRSDGTIDLGSKVVPSTAFYQLRGPRENPNAPPGVEPRFEMITIGAWPKGNRLTQVVGHTKHYTFEWGLGKTTFNTGSNDPRIPFPACSFRTLWAEAMKGGAPKNGVASISYDHRGYRFSIGGTTHNFDFDASCVLLKTK